jgi:hypothetical protein
VNKFLGESRQEVTMRAPGETAGADDAPSVDGERFEDGRPRSAAARSRTPHQAAVRSGKPRSSPLSPRAARRATAIAGLADHDLADRLCLLGDVATGLALSEGADRQVAEFLARSIAQRRGLVAAAIMTENRNPEVVAARAALCRVLRKMGWSLPRVGRSIGRDHSSVLHLLRRQETT